MNLIDLRKDDIKPGNDEVAVYLETLFEDTQKQYLKQHRDWYVNERFVRGDHWIIFNKSLNKIQVIPIQDGEIRRTINKIRTQIRGVKNFIKRNQPRWQSQPLGATTEALENAKKTDKILQYIYRTLKFPFLLTDVIVSGLKFSVGVLEGGIVEEDGKKKIKFWYDDTFDILFDPFGADVNSCRYVIKALKKPKTSVKNNKNYTIKGDLTSDTKDGVSTYKEILEQEKYGKDSSGTSEDLESVLVKETWIKWADDKGKVNLKVFTVASGQLIRVFSPKYRRYPFFAYNPEKEGGAIYSDSWIKDLISMNKSLDKGASQVEAYIQRMLAGKFLIKQGVEVSSITDKGAEKIYYKGSVAPSQLNLQPLPSTPFSHINNLERWIEESGGAREASLGRAPASIQSGKGIEALQAADASTVAEPIENLEAFLADVAEFTLELIEDFTIASEEIIEGQEKIKFIGATEEGLPSETLPIKATAVKVTIVPEIAYSEEAKFERLIRLVEAGVIDPQSLLEKLAVSNISDILERIEVRKQEEFKREMVKQKESHRTSGQSPEDTADLADQENMQMAAGQQVPETPQALWTPEHTELHMAFIQENQDAYNQNQQLFQQHVDAEQQFLSQ